MDIEQILIAAIADALEAGIARETIISELEMQISDLRGERHQ
jgi:hypothetical protein